MLKKSTLLLFITHLFLINSFAQNYSFNFNNSGRRVCLVSSQVNLTNPAVKILFLDSLANNSEPLTVYRRALGTYSWSNVANALAPGTGHWIDNNVSLGDVWEYQVKRENTWNFQSTDYDAIGYTIGSVLDDKTSYKGQLILLVADDVVSQINTKYERLKNELAADDWFVNELIVARASNWDSGSEVVTIKNKIDSIYTNAPANDKPKVLFIFGHVPLPRCGSTAVVAPDDHAQNQGARGCDMYYADIDGIFTDTATFNPGGLSTPLAINLPNDYKWDQDFFPSDIEMAFGRVDFADLTEITTPEYELLENYLDRLSDYKNVNSTAILTEKSAFNLGYNNSNDGSYRTLFNISKPNKVYQNTTGTNHNEWVQNNGPFKIYMQNQTVPDITAWQTFGMDATVYSSDQSYWGFADVPQPNGVYSRIRTLLALPTQCLVTLWTTTGINIFHQACTGEALGIAMKTIMNHNAINNILEKAPQQYDTPEWWNRTHFSFQGDPTLHLYPVAPPQNLSIANINENAILSWNAANDTNAVAYHVYESDAADGTYTQITETPIADTLYNIPNYAQGKWYKVKTVKQISSGCGEFLQASLSKKIEANISLNTAIQHITNSVLVYPNPSEKYIHIVATEKIELLEVTSLLGEIVFKASDILKESTLIDITKWQNGQYFVKIKTINGTEKVERFIKNGR